MLFNEVTAQSESARRAEFVSEGMQNARGLYGKVAGTVSRYAVHLLAAAGKAMVTAGAWLQRRQELDSARA